MSLKFKNPKTPYSEQFDDVYFSESDGIAESEYVYLDGIQFNLLMQEHTAISIGEIGFGVGLNFLLTMKRFHENASLSQNLTYLSFEKFPVLKQDLENLYSHYDGLKPYTDELIRLYPILTSGIHSVYFSKFRVRLILCIGDAETLMKELDPGRKQSVQAWFFDGFAPSKNADAFAADLFQEVARLSTIFARGASFTCAGWVRQNLTDAGFQVEKRKGFGKKRECITAVLKNKKTEISNLTQPWFSLHNTTPLKPGQNVAIVGARLSGCALAQSLIQRGFQVTLIDQHVPQPNQKSHLAGLYSVQFSKVPNPISRFAKQSLVHFINELKDHKELKTHTGVFKGGEDTLALLQNAGYPDTFYRAQTIHGRDGVYFPELGVVNPQDLCAARAIGAELETIKITDQNLNILASFDHIIYAGGADLGPKTGLLLDCFQSTPLRSIRGQIVHCKPTKESGDLDCTLLDEGYVTPILPHITYNEEHIVGSTYLARTLETEEENLRQVQQDKEHLIKETQKKWNLFKSLNMDSITSHQVGYRLSTPDKLPLIGPAFEKDWLKTNYQVALRGGKKHSLPTLNPTSNQWYFLGMSSRGIIYSSFGAEILVSMMLGEIIPLERSLLEHLFSTSTLR